MKALKIQLTNELKKIPNKKLKSIFFGGGTPSCIDAKYYTEIFEELKNFISKDTEITTEANPNSASKQWLEEMKGHGVNRVSFGVQSFDDKKLKFLGRNHNHTQAINAINWAYEVGYKHINCDIIYDTTLDTKELITNDLNIIKTLPIDHISAYSLTIEEGTKFFDRTNVKIEDEDMARYIFEFLKENNFIQYEISNFSKNKEARSKHNFGYWEKDEYLGVGAGAVGCFKDTRYYPLKDVQEYINTPLKYEKEEFLDKKDIKFEKLFLGLRSAVGVSLDIFTKSELKRINLLEKEKKINIKNNRIYNNDFMLTDEVVLFIED